MPNELRAGDHVFSEGLGKGTVMSVAGGDVVVALKDFDGLRVKLPIDTLRRIAPAPATAREQSPAGQPTKPARDVLETTKIPPTAKRHDTAPAVQLGNGGDRAIIEALRFGLVPAGAIEDLTIGYQQLEQWIEGRLPTESSPRMAVSEVCGAFGTGKSHTMAVVRHVAQKRGCLTARVEIDGQRVSLSDPKSLIAHLWPTLSGRTFNSSTPALDLYRMAIERGCAPPIVAPRGIDRIADSYRTIRHLMRTGNLDTYAAELEAVLSCSGEYTAADVRKLVSREPNVDVYQVLIRPMIGIKVADRPYDFIESLIGTALVAKQAGFAGLVITIDEFEIEDMAPRSQKERIESLLTALVHGICGTLEHPPSPLSLFFASVGAEGHVGDSAIQQLIDHTEGERYELRYWPAQRLRELSTRIHSKYVRAYEVQGAHEDRITSSVTQQLRGHNLDEGGLIRAYIKKYVASLDSEYGPPHH